MTALVWGSNKKAFDRGVNQGVLYLDEGAFAWNGLIEVSEETTGAVETTHYYDGNAAHISQTRSHDFTGTLKAFTCPDAFDDYNGFSERETYKSFGFSYRTQRAVGEQIHIVYNASLHPRGGSWSTFSERIDPSSFQWDISSLGVPIPGSLDTTHLILDTEELSWVTRIIEDILYGTDSTDPRLPTPAELVEIYESATSLRITYNNDGTYTAEGAPELLRNFGNGYFEIDAPSVFVNDDRSFVVSSY